MSPAGGPAVAGGPRLLERLERDARRPLTLISAPAGYGKSTLAAQWLESSSLPGVWQTKATRVTAETTRC